MSDALLPEPLRLLTTQADLQYHAAPARGIFNPPAATGMGFWSINPYVGCAFGCAYCYARDTHRYTLERAGEVGRQVAASLPPWLAFERRVLVKEQAGARVREALRSSRFPVTRGIARHRLRHRSLSAGRTPVPDHPRGTRGAGAGAGAVHRAHHQKPAGHP